MDLFFKSKRSGREVYSANKGMDEATVRGLMANLGHTDIEVISQEEYEEALKK